jgi:23S rRNA (adenine2030-N6)-methyltransferase
MRVEHGEGRVVFGEVLQGGNQHGVLEHIGMVARMKGVAITEHGAMVTTRTLVAALQHLTEKDAALTVLDTHAGAGLYRLDGGYASTSGEAGGGILRLTAPGVAALTPALQAYVDMVKAFNQGATTKVYPGSPFIIQRLLRDHDKLKLFELHPTDLRALAGNVAQLEAGRQVAVLHEDGFEGIKKFLPPPARRALVLCDPSYEMKSDYAKVLDMAADSLKRFATGTYAVWYPIIPRPEAHDLPRRLKTLATKAAKGWLHATLTVKSSKLTENAEGEVKRPGLPASGMFLINPPFTLKAALKTALPQMVELLAQDKHATHTLESGG